MGRQHQGMDRPGVRQVPEGSGEQGKMEKTGCKIICGAQTTLAVKELMIMMMVFVTDFLDKYSETGQLVWNGILTNETWVKVGADHGQGSLKMALQLANTDSPN